MNISTPFSYYWGSSYSMLHLECWCMDLFLLIPDPLNMLMLLSVECVNMLRVGYNSTLITCQSQIHEYYNTVRHYCVPFTTVQITRLSFGSKFQRIELFSKASTCAGRLSCGSYLARLLFDLILIVVFSFLCHWPCSSSNFADPCHLLVVFF